MESAKERSKRLPSSAETAMPGSLQRFKDVETAIAISNVQTATVVQNLEIYSFLRRCRPSERIGPDLRLRLAKVVSGLKYAI
jgi:hypothetical protein